MTRIREEEEEAGCLSEWVRNENGVPLGQQVAYQSGWGMKRVSYCSQNKHFALWQPTWQHFEQPSRFTSETQTWSKLCLVQCTAEMPTVSTVLAYTDNMQSFRGRTYLPATPRNHNSTLTIINSSIFLWSGQRGCRFSAKLSIQPRFRQPNDVIHCLRDSLASSFLASFTVFLDRVIEWWNSGQNVYRWWGSYSK